MVCIYCKFETDVNNSRAKARTPSVWRRRSCKQCTAHFTTIELPDYEKSLLVSRPARNKPQPFSRDKLFLSLYKSLGHRSDALNASSALTSTVISRLISKPHVIHRTIVAKNIAMVSLEALKRYDPLAAATYKAYHLSSLKP